MGTSSYSGLIMPTLQDHPHAYGDKWLERFGKNMDWGSSPRVWGQAQKIVEKKYADRIIPTRMGTRNTEKGSANLG